MRVDDWLVCLLDNKDIYFFIFIVETTTYIPPKRLEVTPQTPKRDITPEMIIIIFIGSLICLVLMFEIPREINLFMESILVSSWAWWGLYRNL